jgi:L-threonate 2-dehydrogenase
MNDASEPVQRTGVIGLGAMGSAFARHMVDKGFAVAGYDVDVDAMRRAADRGVASCLAPGEVGNNAEVVIVMVATDDQVDEVIERSDLLDRLHRGGIICITSSCAP